MKPKLFAIILIGAIVLCSLPVVLRTVNEEPSFPGHYVYMHANNAAELGAGNIPVNITPYTLLGIFGGSLVIGFVSAIVCIILLAIMLPKLITSLFKDEKLGYVTTILLMSSPAFVFAGIVNPELLVILTLEVIAAYFFVEGRLVPAFILFGIASLFGLQHVFFILGLGLALTMKKKKWDRFLSLSLLLAVSISVQIPLALRRLGTIDVFSNSPTFFTEFGSAQGITIFFLLLVTGGLFYAFKHKQIKRIGILFAAGFVAYLLPDTFTSAMVVFSLFAAMGATSLLSRKWRSIPLKHLTVLAVCLGLILPSVLFSVSLSNVEPNKEQVEVFDMIKNNLGSQTIFSHASQGPFLEFFTDQEIFISDPSTVSPERLNVSNELWYSYNLETTKKVLEQEDLKIIFLAKDFTQGTVWPEPNQGLHLLLNNNETFKKAFSSNRYNVWLIKS